MKEFRYYYNKRKRLRPSFFVIIIVKKKDVDLTFKKKMNILRHTKNITGLLSIAHLTSAPSSSGPCRPYLAIKLFPFFGHPHCVNLVGFFRENYKRDT